MVKCPCCQRQAPANKPHVTTMILKHEEEDAYLNAIVSEVVEIMNSKIALRGEEALAPPWKLIRKLVLAFRDVDVESAQRKHAVDELLSIERSLNR